MKGLKIDAKSATVGAAGGLAAGVVAGYLVCKRRLSADFERRLDSEVARAKAHYNDKIKVDLRIDKSGFDNGVAAARDALAGQGDHRNDGEPAMGSSTKTPDPRPELTPADVGKAQDPFEGLITPEQADAEAEEREEDALAIAVQEDEERQNVFKQAAAGQRWPRIISVQEFAVTPEGFQCVDLTYYADDKTLVDDKDEPIRNSAAIVGPIDQGSFGGISGDPDICFVRNELLEIDFEVKLSKGSYADLILNYGQPNKGKE